MTKFFKTGIVDFVVLIVTKKQQVEIQSLQDNSLLAFYGATIYERESCNKCHTLNIEEENSNLISLDGLKGKHTSSWYYYYLYEPQKLYADCFYAGTMEMSIEPEAIIFRHKHLVHKGVSNVKKKKVFIYT